MNRVLNEVSNVEGISSRNDILTRILFCTLSNVVSDRVIQCPTDSVRDITVLIYSAMDP